MYLFNYVFNYEKYKRTKLRIIIKLPKKPKI